jgi:hypothetical protein
MFPADCRSVEASDVVHCVFDVQFVTREVPATRIVEPGPGLDVMKLLPETSSVKPPAEPAYALVGAREKMLRPLVIVTVAAPDWLVSSALVATMPMVSGEGAAGGAVYKPVESMTPHAPAVVHAVPVIDQVTC